MGDAPRVMPPILDTIDHVLWSIVGMRPVQKQAQAQHQGRR